MPLSIRRIVTLTCVAALFIVMPFVYDPAPVAVDVPTPTPGRDCTIEYRQGMGWENWQMVEVCGE